jgi:hypothetical protein
MTVNASVTQSLRRHRRRFVADRSGQTLIEGALVLPLLILVCLGVVELGMAIQHEHLVSAMSREGSNLISRDTSLDDGAVALEAVGGTTVDFGANARVIFSVLKRGATVNTPNYGKLILYQRYEYGTGGGSSKLATTGGSFGPGPDHIAYDSDTDTSLQVTNVSNDLASVNGALIYVTEIFSEHTLITPIDRLGVIVPQQLYSAAYF